MRNRSRSRELGFPAAALVALLTGGTSPAVPQPPPAQTLCVLDFHRLGGDATADWLEKGLADMMISTLNRIGPYQVIERRYLRDLLREHGLARTGLVDTDTAIRQARLAKAQLLLQGSFARLGDRLTVQVRLIRTSDQRILAQSTWTGPYAQVLSAPRTLGEDLLARSGTPVDPGRLEGIEKKIPRTIDVAKAYYEGVQAFDDGRYPEALAHYLDAAEQAGDFIKAYPAVIEMYYLLGQSQHAVLFAHELARSYEGKGDVPSALEYYFVATKHCVDPLGNPGLAIPLLENFLRLVSRHEQQTGEIATTKRAILARIDELLQTGKYKDFGKILADRDIRYQMWPSDIDSELTRREGEQARGGSVPKPSLLMWQMRAQRELARSCARVGQIETALDHYRELLGVYEFLTSHPLYEGTHRDSIRTEAHFMLLRHYAGTGRLVRDHPMNQINRLNVVGNGLVFRRDFRDHPGPDARARVSSRYEGRGYEYFDFAAPEGHQIDSVTLRAEIEGIGEFGLSLPDPAGWPPQFSFSKRMENFKFSSSGHYERKMDLPPGTAFVSLGTSWGPGLFSNTLVEVLRHRLLGPGDGPGDGPDIVSWELSFAVSPAEGMGAGTLPSPTIQNLIHRYTAGWERSFAVRDGQTVLYNGNPRLDVYAEDWLVYSMDGDIQVYHRQDPKLRIAMPVTINTRDREFDPSLVRTRDGRYALLWARGTSKRNASRFVAFSSDLLRWDTPERMVFDEPAGDAGYTYSRAEPLERTYNVAPVGRGYAMLLAQGFFRYSDDLRSWGPAQRVLEQDLYRNRLLKTPDGTVWAVYENSSDELQPYTPEDWLHGYFVTDGKRYRHVTELHLSRSRDGIQWEEAGKIVLPGQPSGLWAFAVSERQIGVAVASNNLHVKWFTAALDSELHQIESGLNAMHHSEEADFFVQDASLACVRPVFDFERQKQMLLATVSKALYRRFTE